MIRISPILRLLIYSVAVCLIFTGHLFAQSEDVKLSLDSPVESEIKGGETRFFSITLGSGKTGRIEIVQNGVDVSLAAINPKGDTFITSESPSGFFGDDLILVTSGEAGEYKISVTPADPRAKMGKFTILLKEVRPTTPEDTRINKASGEITKVAEAALVLKYKGTIQGKRDAVKNLREVERLSKIKKDRVWEGVAILQIGLIEEQLGELQNALDSYFSSLKIFRELDNQYFGSSAVNNIGAVYGKLGENEKAISYYSQALELQRDVGNRKSIGIFLNNIGNSYRLLGNYEQAEKFLRESLVIKREDKSIRGKRSVANTLNNLGATLIKRGKQDEGIAFMQQSLDMRREIKHNRGIANSLVTLGSAQRETGRKQEGYTNLSEGNLFANKVGDRQLEARSLYQLAVAERERGNLTLAIENVSKGLDLIEKIRGELVSSEIRYTYFSTVQDYYELYIDLLFSRFEKDKNEADVAHALEMSERSRSRSLVELLHEARVDFRKGINPANLAKLKDLQTEINSKYSDRQRILGGKPKPEQISKINNDINELNTAIQNLKIRIRRENPRYSDLTNVQTVSADEFQILLDEDTVLIEYKLGTKRSFMWLVTTENIEMYELPGRDIIENTARRFYDLTIENDRIKTKQREVLAEQLGKVLLPDAAKEIEGKRLAIVADGILQYVPYSALRAGQSQYLTEKNEIIVLPSASVLSQIRKNPGKTNPDRKTIAVFADPVFDKNDSRLSKESKPAAGSQNGELDRVLRDFKFGEELPRLLASRREANGISNLVNQDMRTLNTDFEADLENVETAGLANYQIVHFATHGLLNTSHPELSGLVFSLFDKEGRSQDGFLSLNNIYNLELSSDMVVLSACQTALGKDVRGEGLIGLSRGFLYAGSSRVIASLWKVDDAATAEFMERFYRNHLQKGLPAAKALQQAKIEMKNIRRYSSPFYWSAFTLLGDWE
ncbi:MAG: CHAT domain-containing protein [Pyrinomonadaceae bacterium]|nr:CHAT domain-containing protein [Pyrinomonadaceae bacterium]